jgi:acyl-coenzyme A thioesterase PaaI-like protein
MAVAAKTDRCWVCGPNNPGGLHVPFEPDGNHGSVARYVAREEHGGWPGMLHGGVIFALMDEALGWALYFHGLAGVTARFKARYREAIPIGAELTIRAWTMERRRNLVRAVAEVRRADDGAKLLVEATATMVLVDVSEAGGDV